MQLRAAIRAVYQAREQTTSPCFRIPTLALAELLYTEPCVLINNGILRVGNDLPFIFRIVNPFVNLVAYTSGYKIHGAAGVLTILQNMA